MNLSTCMAITGIIAALLLSGCGDETQISATSTNTVPTTAQAAALPADLFSDEPITDAASLVSVKESAKAGDEVQFVAAIGGRKDPFIDGRAVMVVSDLGLAFCTDGCPVPWDACCALPEDVAKKTAMVQVVDEQGAPLPVGLAERLKPGTEIQVSGVVHTAEEGATIINARRIHIAH
jgi:hypothetical protein